MYLNEGTQQTISTIDSTKNAISLVDGSKWEAKGIYTYKLALWLTLETVIIKKSVINFEMTNVNRNETIEVKQSL